MGVIMEENRKLEKLANMFDMLSDVNRLHIVVYLMNGKQTVSNITEHIGMSQSAVSHQLRILRDAHILNATKSGKSVYYSIRDEHVETIVNNGLVHMGHEE